MKMFFFKIKYAVRKFLPNSLWLAAAKKIKNFRTHQYSEKRKTYGDKNPNLIFYVIRKRPPASGFFANTYHVLQGIMYAKQRNYIPVVDMKNYWVDELSRVKKINGSRNAWEYFFKPLSSFSLKEVYQSQNVILSNGDSILLRGDALHGRNLIGQVSSIKLLNGYFKEGVKINDPTKSQITQIKHDLRWDPDMTLGIFIRGTAYNKFLNLKDFTVDIDFFIKTCKEMLIKHSLTKVYISTEDFSLYNKIKPNFLKSELVPSIRFASNLTLSDWVSSQKINRDGSIKLGYKKTLLYLAEAKMLSECKYFVGSISNASIYILGNSDLETGEKILVKHDHLIHIT